MKKHSLFYIVIAFALMIFTQLAFAEATYDKYQIVQGNYNTDSRIHLLASLGAVCFLLSFAIDSFRIKKERQKSLKTNNKRIGSMASNAYIASSWKDRPAWT